MARVLLVEDDRNLSEMVREWLTASERHTIDIVHSGKDGLRQLDEGQYDAVLLDWHLPDIEGIEMLRIHRSAGGRTPVLMLTERSQTRDRLTGLDSGADDYLPKPFDFIELAARLRALLRRTGSRQTGLLEFGDIVIDVQASRVTRRGVEIELMPTEFSLLEFLVRHPEQTFSAEALLARVWHDADGLTSDAVRTCIKRLRKKLDAGESDSIIKNAHGKGYFISGG